MQTTLQPPGICTLSDRVIGSVVQRTLPYRQRFLNESVDPHDNRQHPSLYPPDPLCSTRKTLDEVDGHSSTFMGPCVQEPAPRLRVSKRNQFPRQQRQKEEEGYAITVERRREYYRTKQQRYRERQRKCEVLLVKKAEQLQQETTLLRQHRDRLTFQVPRSLTVWIAATEYFRISRRGISTREDTHPNDLDFLRATMAPDISFRTSSGVDTLVKHWGLFTQWFPDVHVELKQLKEITEHSLVAFTATSFTMSADSLLDVFPHLFKGEGGSRCARVAAKLRDQQLVLRGAVRFDWDDESKQVVRLQNQVDMMSAMVKLLGSLEDVALVFSGALITPECNLRDEGSG